MKKTILNFKDFLLLEQSKYSDSVPYGKLFEAGEAEYTIPTIETWINARIGQRIDSDKFITPDEKVKLKSVVTDYNPLIESIKNVYLGNTKSDDSYSGFVWAGIGVIVLTTALLSRRTKLLKPIFQAFETFIQKKIFKKTYAKSTEIDRIVKFATTRVFNPSQNLSDLADIKVTIPKNELAANAKEIMISEDLRLMFKSNDLTTIPSNVYAKQNVYKCYSKDIIDDLTVDKSTGNLFYENVQVGIDKKGVIYHPRILQTITGEEVSTLKEFVNYLTSNIKSKNQIVNDLNQVYDAAGEAVPNVTTKSSNIMTTLMKVTSKSIIYGSIAVGDLALFITAWSEISAKILPNQNQQNPYGKYFIEILKSKFEETQEFKNLKNQIVENIPASDKVPEHTKYEKLPYRISYHLACLVNEYVSQVAPAMSFIAIMQKNYQTA